MHRAGLEQQRESKGRTHLNEDEGIDPVEQLVAPHVGCIALFLDEQRAQGGLHDVARVPVFDEPVHIKFK